MNDNSYTHKIINSSNTEAEQVDFDKVVEQLSRYATLLEKQIKDKKIGQIRGDYSQLDHETQMVDSDLEHNGDVLID